MLIANALERTASELQRFVPARFAEDRKRVRRVHREVCRFRHPGLADQRPGQALWVMRVIEAESALDAQPFVVRRSVAAFHPDYAVVFDVVGELAAHAAIGADGRHGAIDRHEVGVMGGSERAGRAGLDALATGYTCRFAHWIAEIEDDLRMSATEGVADDVIDLLLAARADAACALYARIKVDRHGRMRNIGRRLRSRVEARLADAQHALPVRQLRIGPIDFGRHVGRQQLNDHPLRVQRPGAVACHLHRGDRTAAAGGSEYALAFDFDHAGAAIAVRPHTGLVAEAGDGNAGAVGHLDDRLVRQGGNVLAVEPERDALLLQCLRQWCIHGPVLSAGNRSTVMRAPAEST
jgi:hypothetical protein